MIVERLF